jgi:hypothetical protein
MIMEKKEIMENKDITLAQKELEQIEQNEYEERLALLRQKYILDMNAIKDFGFDEGVEKRKKRAGKRNGIIEREI